MSVETTPDRPVDSVQSLQRGLSVIRAFDDRTPKMTVSEVAKKTGLTRATARRFLHTLVAVDYMATDGRDFWLRPRVLELGFAYLSSISLPDLVMGHLGSLAATVNESTSVSVLDGTDIVFVATVPIKRVLTVQISVGTRFPAYATAMGRVLVSALPSDAFDGFMAENTFDPLTPHTITSPDQFRSEIDKVREQGWALVDQELELELRTIAVPIRDGQGEVVAAMNVSSSARRGSVRDLEKNILPALFDAAAQTERDLKISQFDRSSTLGR